MKPGLACLVILVVTLPGIAAATTAPDLSGRITLDGRLGEYAADEWVLGQTGSLLEPSGDSAWGSDNDVGRVATTWDTTFLYIGVECVTLDSRLLVLIDHAPGGVADMRSLGPLRRSIAFPAGFRPDLVLEAQPQSVLPVAWRVNDGFERLADAAVRGSYRQSGLDGGALEVAIPWSVISPRGPRLAIMAVVTGGEGSGCGDAAPDPNGRLSAIRSDGCVLDRPLTLSIDADADGIADTGLSPVAVAAVDPRADGGDDIEIDVAVRSFAPDDGESTRFSIRRAGGGDAFVSVRVYTRAGELVTVLYDDELRSLDSPAEDTWDGTDRFGRIVSGGIYLINVSWGAARGERSGTTSAGVAVVR